MGQLIVNSHGFEVRQFFGKFPTLAQLLQYWKNPGYLVPCEF